MTSAELNKALETDSKLAECLRTAKDSDAFIAQAKAMGYDITKDALSELDLDTLDSVSGGIVPM